MKSKLFRSALCVLLTLLLLLGTFTIAVSAESEGDRIYKGTFRYYDRTEDFYYSDGYFKTSGTEKNAHLRTLSAAVAFATEPMTDDNNNILDLLIDTGFDPATVDCREMDVTGVDTIGTVIAQKKIGSTPLVLVSIRGVEYGAEWASNFIAGTDGDAEGFREAADKVLDRLGAYLEEYDLSDAKIWVCGYSRGGSVANLVGRELNKAPGDYRTAVDDIYVYTFEAPACSADDTVYPNIHNVANSGDLFTYFYPKQWGLYLNGVKEKVGDPDATLMTKKLNVSLTDFSVADYKEVKVSDFLDQFSEAAFTLVDREDYVNELQDYLAQVNEIIYSKSWMDQKNLLKFLEQAGAIFTQEEELSPDFFMSLFNDALNDGSFEEFGDLILTNLDTAREEMQPPLTEEEYQTVLAAAEAFVKTMEPMIEYDILYSEKDESGAKVYAPFYFLLTLTTNIADFISPHIHHNLFDCLTAEDPYYDDDFTVAPGSIYADGTVYTYAELGDELYSKAIELNFARHDIYMLRGGYDLRIEAQVTPHEYDFELIMNCMGCLPKSRNYYGLYDIKVVKSVGFRTYPCDRSAIASISIRDEIANYTKYYSVARACNDTYAEIPCKRIIDPSGTTRVLFEVKGSAVYCVANGDLDKEPIDVLPGDVDKDGEITSIDVTLIQRFLALMEEFTAEQEMLADVDEDGEVTSIDVTQIQRYLAYIPSVLDD